MYAVALHRAVRRKRIGHKPRRREPEVLHEDERTCIRSRGKDEIANNERNNKDCHFWKETSTFITIVSLESNVCG